MKMAGKGPQYSKPPDLTAVTAIYHIASCGLHCLDCSEGERQKQGGGGSAGSGGGGGGRGCQAILHTL